MPPVFRPHKDHKHIEAQLARGILEGYFKCKRCGYLGYSAQGGKNKHLARNEYCKSLGQNPRPLKQRITMDLILQNEVVDDLIMDDNWEAMEIEEVNVDRQESNRKTGRATTRSRYDDPRPPIEEEPPIRVGKDTPLSVLPKNQLYIQQHPFTEARPAPVSPRIPPELPAFWPFRTLEDFLQAEIFDDGEFSRELIDRQLALHRENPKITLRDEKDLRVTLSKALVLEDEKFHSHEVHTQVRGKSYTNKFHCRDIMTVIRELVADPDLADLFVFEPEKRFMRRANGTGNDRVYEEYHQADDFWELRTTIGNVHGKDASPLVVILYADETQLTSFGNNTVWSVYLWLGNLPHQTRASFGKGGATLLAYLPKGQQPDGMSDGDVALYRCMLYHECFRVILRPMLNASKLGDCFRTGDGGVRTLVPVVALKPGDYPELCRMSGIISKDALAACPAGTTPTEDFDKTDIECPPRDHSKEQKAIQKALGPTPTSRDGIPTPKSLGIRPVVNAFDPVTNLYFANCRTMGADALHWMRQGMFGRIWFKELLDQLTASLKRKLDYQFRKMPRYPDLHHFAKGVSSLKWRSGSDHAVIAKLIVPILETILPPIDKLPLRTDILRLFRYFAECMVLIGFSTHTDSTLDLLRDVLKGMATHEKDLAKSWGISLFTPKHHFMHCHLIQSIKSKGPVRNTDTGMGEARHPESKHGYARSNHHPDTVEEQMIRHVLNREIIQKVRARLDQSSKEAPILANSIEMESSPEAGSHVKFGSPDRTLQMQYFLQELAKRHSLEMKYLTEKLQRYLYYRVPSLQQDDILRPREHHLPDISGFSVVNYKKAQIDFISLENSNDMHDIIRANPKWYNSGPRYDYVLINRDHQSISCVQVMGLFAVKISGTAHPVALVRCLNIRPRNSRHGYFECSPSNEYRFVPPGSFIRSVFVQYNPIDEAKYFINDTIDSDMLLRLRNASLQTYQ